MSFIRVKVYSVDSSKSISVTVKLTAAEYVRISEAWLSLLTSDVGVAS